jgi:putative membrane protein
MKTAQQFPRDTIAQNRLLKIFLVLLFSFWITAWAFTADRINFYIENILVVTGLLLLVFTARRFRFSTVGYTCIFIFLMLHLYGAQYAYTANPLGEWLQTTFKLNRNPYDRIVHFSFGFLLVYPARDFMTQKLDIRGRAGWFLPAELILSLAAAFELVEWAVADVIFPAHGASYVATQGDPWDAQKDIFVAVVGAAITLGIAWYIQKYNESVRVRHALIQLH